MNTRMKNAQILCVEQATRAQNYTDCDVVAEALEQTRNAQNNEALCDAVDYLITALQYRAYDNPIGTPCVLNALKVIRNEYETIKDGGSLRDHCENKDAEGRTEWASKAHKGERVRIM